MLHRREIAELSDAMLKKGLTVVPLKMYLKNGMAKVELGVARGKKAYDKRETIARRDAQRDMERELTERSRKGRPR